MTAKEDVLARLDEAAPGLKVYAVKELWLFGSAAREEMRGGSDVDILVDFSAPVTRLACASHQCEVIDQHAPALAVLHDVEPPRMLTPWAGATAPGSTDFSDAHVRSF